MIDSPTGTHHQAKISEPGSRLLLFKRLAVPLCTIVKLTISLNKLKAGSAWSWQENTRAEREGSHS